MQGPLKTPAPGAPLASNRTNRREAKVLQQGAMQIAQCLYDFSLDGGAVGSYAMRTRLPRNAVITNVYADVETAATSGGSATYQVKAGSTNLSAALAYDSATSGINAVGIQALPTAASSPFEAVKLSATSASELSMAIAGAALTAGKVRFTIQYFISK